MATSAGGSAASAGIRFQQRLGAWFSVAMLTRLELSHLLGIPRLLAVRRISFETADAIDDLVLDCDTAALFVQAKTSVSLSKAKASEFSSALRQFLRQFLSRQTETDLYLLAVSSKASRRIREDFAKLLHGFRLSGLDIEQTPLNASEREALSIYRSVMDHLHREFTGRPMTADEFLAFSKRVYIASFDLEESGADTRSAHVLLSGAAGMTIAPEHAWSRVLDLAIDCAAKRLAITADGLERHLNDLRASAPLPDADHFFEPIIEGTVATGREVLVATHPDHLNKLLVFDIRRFDEAGAPRALFEGNTCTFIQNHDRYTVLHRAATFAGAQRWLLENQDTTEGKEAIIAPSNWELDLEATPAARAQRQTAHQTLLRKNALAHCVRCGRPVSSAVATLVEVDDRDSPYDVGVTHKDCHQPIYRTLGEVKSEFFAANRALVDFDVRLWVMRLRRGQGLLRSMERRPAVETVVVAWNPEGIPNTVHRYCLKATLEDGSEVYITRRMRVERYSQQVADQKKAEFLHHIREAQKARDPYCFSSETRVFGTYSQVTRMAPQEKPIRCTKAEIVPYTAAIGKTYDFVDDYYAPLMVLRNATTEQILEIQGRAILLSDALRVAQFVENWQKAGHEIGSYRLDIVPDDAAFDRLMASLVADGKAAVIDPLFDMQGNRVSGFRVDPMPAESQ